MARFGETLTNLCFSLNDHRYGERLSKQQWSQILGPLKVLHTLDLTAEENFGNLDTRSLPLAHTVRFLRIDSWGDDDKLDGQHLANLLRSFTSLEQLSLTGTLDNALAETLPQTLRKLHVWDWEAGGILNILRRLADPQWLPRLAETPILRVRNASDGYAFGGLLDADLLPSRRATRHIDVLHAQVCRRERSGGRMDREKKAGQIWTKRYVFPGARCLRATAPTSQTRAPRSSSRLVWRETPMHCKPSQSLEGPSFLYGLF